jgi:hypothetical protein
VLPALGAERTPSPSNDPGASPVSTYVTASPVPLFDRLAFPAPQSADGRLLDAAGLQASVRLDLSRLLNVRNALSIEAFLQSEGTVLHYGLPDLLSLSSQSDADLERLAEVVAHGIALRMLIQIGIDAAHRQGVVFGQPVDRRSRLIGGAIQFGTVAGRQDRRFAHRSVAQQVMQR